MLARLLSFWYPLQLLTSWFSIFSYFAMLTFPFVTSTTASYFMILHLLLLHYANLPTCVNLPRLSALFSHSSYCNQPTNDCFMQVTTKPSDKIQGFLRLLLRLWHLNVSKLFVIVLPWEDSACETLECLNINYKCAVLWDLLVTSCSEYGKRHIYTMIVMKKTR